MQRKTKSSLYQLGDDEHDIESLSHHGPNVVNVVEGPEALVRNDTLWINCLRVFLIGTLLIVAVVLSLETFKVLKRLEDSTFQTSFERIASRISYNFVDAINIRIWAARLAAYSLRKVPSFRRDIVDLDVQTLNDLTFGARAATLLEGIQWSPLLWDDDQQKEWEAYAHQAKQRSTNKNAINVCYVCGKGMEVGSPTSIITSASYGNFPCGLLEMGALGGLLSATTCGELTEISEATCQCRPKTEDGNAIGNKVARHIFQFAKNGTPVADQGPFPLSPVWKAAPQPPADALLYNQMRDPIRKSAVMSLIDTKLPTFSETRYPDGEYEGLMNTKVGFPKSAVFYPVMGDGPNNQTVVGTISLNIVWNYVFGFGTKLPWYSRGVIMVIQNNRGQQFTYQITDNHFANFLGEGDLHDPKFDSMMIDKNVSDSMKNTILRAAPDSNSQEEVAIVYNLRIYPSEAFKRQFITNKPWIYTSVVAFIFIFTTAMCILYDVLVRRRQSKVMKSAEQSNALLTSLFPDFIKTRLMARVDQNQSSALRPGSKENSLIPIHFSAPKHQLKTMLGKAKRRSSIAFRVSEPIADFFPNVTVIFADISGFTAWSSEREPTQVFQLLETLYEKFDALADKHGVFKIETIGDCYVAVTGLPEPQTDHASRMVQFGHDIMCHMHELVVSLESQLGPGTGSLSIRVGLHSGSVTGGVLRGDRARFQLFGDTMNMASRMQSTGEVNKIQVSESTASLLMDAGHGCWLERRESKVLVKGKGDMRTFWVDSTCNEDVDDPQNAFPEPLMAPDPLLLAPSLTEVRTSKHRSSVKSKEPLVKWNTDLLERFLKQVVAGRNAALKRRQRIRHADSGSSSSDRMTNEDDVTAFGNHRPIDDVTAVIVMTDFSETNTFEQLEPESVELSEAVYCQLRDYVKRISEMYRANPFHNFEHASHVAMSASKIIKRIVRPDDVDYSQENVRRRHRRKLVARKIHQSTFGISSDALMQFALVFSAVIHDVDHSGVSNAQLVKEQNELAVRYDNKSVAEQHSVRIAWDILMNEEFHDLRACIYKSEDEKIRFRQLVVNAVISTDIFDKDLQTLRKIRWNNAFHDSIISESTASCNFDVLNLPQTSPMALVGDEMSRKATVVFEYIIQASDVAHTMQHWHVYSRWNERLFKERYQAFVNGREEQDPSLGWYHGEILFFDNYIIPLARKLETCGVFGVSSDEYLNYALENRHEWERKGRDIVQNLMEKYSCSGQDHEAVIT